MNSKLKMSVNVLLKLLNKEKKSEKRLMKSANRLTKKLVKRELDSLKKNVPLLKQLQLNVRPNLKSVLQNRNMNTKKDRLRWNKNTKRLRSRD